MLPVIYFSLFTIFSIVFIILKSIKKDEYFINNEFIRQIANYAIFIKGIPALLAFIFVFLIRPDDSLFYFVLMGALIFCFAGDLRMEKGLISGLSLFLIAQVLFSIAFIGQSLANKVVNDSFLPISIVFLCIIIYIILFVHYLDSSELGLGKFKTPVIIYCVAISLMFLSTILLWTTLGFLNYLEFGLVSLGGFLFIFSDSIIALREFRNRKFAKNVLIIMITYYSAIFLLSLSSMLI
ncbi:MAG: lysoplasmalogenase [Candidatus Hodarchaeota archaeon]